MFPYGASPSRIRSAPTTPASPTSITPRGASRLSPTRKPSRKTAAAAITQVGQTDDSARRPPAEPDPESAGEQVREHGIDERDAPEDLAAIEERERDREAEQDEQVEIPHRQRPAQIGETEEEDEAEARARRTACRSVLPPNEPSPPRAIFHATCGPVHASVTGRVVSSTTACATCPASPDQTFTSPRARLVAEVRRRRRVRRIALEPGRDLRMREREARSPCPRRGAAGRAGPT